MKKLFIIILVLFLVISISYLFNDRNDNLVDSKVITYDEYLKLNDNGFLVDVRTIEEFNEGHLENSINIELDNIDNILDVVSDKDSQIFVYCRSGVRSSEAIIQLIDLGYTNVYDLGGVINIDVELVK